MKTTLRLIIVICFYQSILNNHAKAQPSWHFNTESIDEDFFLRSVHSIEENKILLLGFTQFAILDADGELEQLSDLPIEFSSDFGAKFYRDGNIHHLEFLNNELLSLSLDGEIISRESVFDPVERVLPNKVIPIDGDIYFLETHHSEVLLYDTKEGILFLTEDYDDYKIGNEYIMIINKSFIDVLDFQGNIVAEFRTDASSIWWDKDEILQRVSQEASSDVILRTDLQGNYKARLQRYYDSMLPEIFDSEFAQAEIFKHNEQCSYGLIARDYEAIVLTGNSSNVRIVNLEYEYRIYTNTNPSNKRLIARIDIHSSPQGYALVQIRNQVFKIDNICGSGDELVDRDLDGFTNELDCNDSNSSINPQANEVDGNWVDENCDGYDSKLSKVPVSPQYASFSGGLSGRGTFDCVSMPDFDYKINGDYSQWDTSVPGPPQVMDNNGGGFERIFGAAGFQENIEIEVDGYFGNAGDPITKEVYTTLDFDGTVPAFQLGFVIADVEQDQVQISALDANGNPIPSSIVANWYQTSFDADETDNNSNPPKPPSWDASTNTLVGHHASGGVKQTEYQLALPDDEASAAWFFVNVPITQLKFTSQALGITPDDPSMHFLFASRCDVIDQDDEIAAPYVDIYPWLEMEVTQADCPSLQVTEYDLGAFTYVYISDGRLFFQDGTFYCQTREDFDCLSFYNLTDSSISNSWNCGEESENGGESENGYNEFTEVFPWLENISQGYDCDQLTVTAYDLGAFSFVYLTDTNKSDLYFEDGTFYCADSESRDCRGLYNLADTDISNVWTCGNIEMEVDNESENNVNDDIFSEYTWLSGVIDPDCSVGSVEEFKQGSFSFILIDNGMKRTLYFQDGTFYCQDSESYSCIELYGLSQPLRSFSCDGSNVNQSHPRSLERSYTQSSWSISPNPSSGLFNVKHSVDVSQIYIFDISGQLVIQMKVHNAKQTKLDLGDQEAGIYILKMYDGFKTITEKVVRF